MHDHAPDCQEYSENTSGKQPEKSVNMLRVSNSLYRVGYINYERKKKIVGRILSHAA